MVVLGAFDSEIVLVLVEVVTESLPQATCACMLHQRSSKKKGEKSTRWCQLDVQSKYLVV